MSREAVTAALCRSAVFADLPAAELERVAAASRVRRLTKDEVVFARGDPGGGMYLVAVGSVSLTVTSADGGQVVLAILLPPQTFGELAVVDAGPRAATATAREATVLIAIPRAELTRLMEAQPKVAVSLLASLATLVRQISEHANDLVLLDLPGRVAKFLLATAHVHPDEIRPGQSVRIDLRLSQTELARLTGGSRQHVNRLIVALESEGAITRQGSRIVAVRPDLLASV
jgi:CRP/FNR family transcriptional regulator, cyclic AMP receptor protein